MDLAIVALYTLGFILLLILTQDVHIFPGAFLSKAKFWCRKRKAPSPIESIFIRTSDHIELELWRYPAKHTTNLNEYVAMIFHGNGGPVDNFLFIQMWLSDLGISSYNFDYRGFGRSGGWPTEKGIYLDSDAVWRYVIEREKINPQNVIIVGMSIGAAPAARIASLHQPKLLLLVSAFTNLRNTVRAQPFIGLLAPFVRHYFPTIDYVRKLKSTHLLLAHGLSDRIVPLHHSNDLEAQYCGTGKVLRLCSDEAGHSMAVYALKDKLAASFSELLRG